MQVGLLEVGDPVEARWKGTKELNDYVEFMAKYMPGVEPMNSSTSG